MLLRWKTICDLRKPWITFLLSEDALIDVN